MTLSRNEIPFVNRLREILISAPWSSFDLISSLITLGLGVYLSFNISMFDEFGGAYNTLGRFGSEVVWAIILILGGLYSVVATLWCIKPYFVVRLLSRMVVSFCVVSIFLNNLGNSPPPLSTVTYGILSLFCVWGIIRTSPRGR